MSITSAIVLFVVIWFLVMFLTLPIRRRTQGDVGDVMPGTPAGAPVNFRLKRTILIVTGISAILWAVIAGIIVSGMITIQDIDWVNRLGKD